MAGSISTHVLDTGSGRPASNVVVTLYRGAEVVAKAATDADGRIKDLARDLAPGPYRVEFETGMPFYRRVSFDVLLPDGHVHLPLVLSPFGVASYRGS